MMLLLQIHIPLLAFMSLLASMSPARLAAASISYTEANANNLANEISFVSLEGDDLSGQAMGSSMKQQYRKPPMIFENDLVDFPNVEPRPTAFQLQQVANRDNQMKQQQQQDQDIPQLVGQKVINGNHATYVEPPADFKPIIYIHQKQHSDANNISPASNKIPPARLDADDRASQPPLRATSSERVPMVSSLDERDNMRLDEMTEVGAIKPSVSRWTDWRDMSIEPDLASSDGSPLFMYAAVPAKSPFKIRKNSLSSLAMAEKLKDIEASESRNHVKHANSVSRRAVANGDLNAPRSIDMARSSSVASQLGEPDLAASEASGFQLSNPISSGTKTSGGSLRYVGSSGLTSPASKQASLGNLHPSVRLQTSQQQQQQQQQQQPRSSQSALKSGKQNGENYHDQQQPQDSNQNQRDHKKTPQRPRRLKRRRKSKSGNNTEVRIQQLVQQSQRQQQQQLQPPAKLQPKQVNGLATLPMNDHNQQQTLSLPRHSQHPQQQQQQQQQPEFQQRSSNVVKRTDGSLVSVGSELAGSVGGNVKRSVSKQRRLRTVLPVGLSSWFLGGIRDLDGRHWHLPSDIINRLAINDVDFSSTTRAHPPTPGANFELIEPNQPEEATTPPAGIQLNRIPSGSRLVPR